MPIYCLQTVGEQEWGTFWKISFFVKLIRSCHDLKDPE